MTESRALDLSFATAGTRTVFDRRRYRWPQTVGRMFYLDPLDVGRGSVIVQNAGASLHPGDRVQQRIAVTAGARVEVVGQGAMLVTGVPEAVSAAEETELHAEASSMLLYGPEPRILTEFAHVEQNTCVTLESDAVVVLTEAVIVHPDVSVESFGSFRSRVIVTVAGDLRMLDAQHVTSMPVARGGLRGFATVFLLGAVPPDSLVGAALDGLDGRSGVYAAGTVLPNAAGYAVRIAASGGDTLRHGIDLVRRVLEYSLSVAEVRR